MASPAFGNLVSSYGLKSNGMSAMDVVAGVPVRITNYQAILPYISMPKIKKPHLLLLQI